jgi:type VI secretion system protein ImpA
MYAAATSRCSATQPAGCLFNCSYLFFKFWSYMVGVVDVDRLLVEISPEAPSGLKDRRYENDLFELENRISKISVEDTTDEHVQKGAWREIQKKSFQLCSRCHDLQAAMYLTRALLQTNGLAGFSDGLRLLQELVERYWESLYPALDASEKGDSLRRVGILEELNDWQITIRPLMSAEICESRAIGSFNLRDIRIATGRKLDKLVLTEKEKKSAPNPKAIEAAFKSCELEDLKLKREATQESLKRLNRIETVLKEKIGAAASPDFQRVFNVLEEMDAILGQHLALRTSEQVDIRPEPEPENAKKSGENNPENNGQALKPITLQKENPDMIIRDRQDIIQLLEQICLYYQQNEPASPVPLLLRRAMRLVEKDFFEIIKDLAPDSVKQIQLISGATEEKS